MKQLYALLLLFFILFSNIQCSKAERECGSPPNDSIEFDDSIRYGCLPNGITYYIKPLRIKQARVYLNLYVKAGFNLEDQLQEEVAHGIEHLAFEPSTHFPKGLFNTLDAWKYKFNGTCGPRITKYQFNPPTKNFHVVDSALFWFQDIAEGINLTAESIDKVKADLAQEFVFRVGQNSDNSTSVANLYAGLFPARKSSEDFLNKLKKVEDKDIIRFYRDWYQPNLMAISVVGNIKNVDSLEGIIKKRFSHISIKNKPMPIPNFDSIYYNSTPQFTKVIKSSNSLTSFSRSSCKIQMYYRAPSIIKELHTMVGVKNLLKLELLNEVLNTRLKEQTIGYNSIGAGSIVPFRLNGLPPSICIDITTGRVPVKQSIESTMRVIKQFQQFGVKKKEWEKLKNQRLSQFDSTLADKPDYWINEIVKHFKFGEALPNQKHEKLKKWLTNYKLTEFNDFIKKFLSSPPKDIGLIIPPKHGALKYTEKEIRSFISNALKSKISPYTLIESPLKLMSKEQIQNLELKDYKSREVKESGVVEIKLANGVTVILLPYKPLEGVSSDRILIHGFSPNGASCFPKKDYFSTVLAPSIVEHSGVGTKDKFTLKQILSESNISIQPYIGVYEAGIAGNSSLNELPELLQLTYLYFTVPRKSPQAFEDWKVNEQKRYYQLLSNIIRRDLSNTIREFTGDSSFARSSIVPARFLTGTNRINGVKECELNRAIANYKELFGNAKDFTFIITGDFSTDSILPIIQKYLGNLPSKTTLDRSCFKLKNPNLKRGPYMKEVSTAKFNLVNTKYALRFYSNPNKLYSWKDEIKVKLLMEIVERITWSLRFEKGYSFYYLGTYAKYNHHMKRIEIELDIDCDKNDFTKIRSGIKRIVANLKKGHIQKELAESQLDIFVQDYSNLNSKTQRQWLLETYNKYRFGVPITDPVLVQKYVKALTIEDVVDVANKYFQDENLFEFVMKN